MLWESWPHLSQVGTLCLESGPCTSPRQRCGAGSGGKGVGELTLPPICHGMDGTGTEVNAFHPHPSHTLPPLAVGKAAHGVMGSGELALSVHHPLQRSGEQILHLIWAAQYSWDLVEGAQVRQPQGIGITGLTTRRA